MVLEYCAKYKKKYIDRGSMVLLDKDTAIDCVNYFFEQQYSLVCVDGFFLFSENRIQPTQDHSIDFTRDPFDGLNESQIQAVTRAFFQNEPEGVYYEIVVS